MKYFLLAVLMFFAGCAPVIHRSAKIYDVSNGAVITVMFTNYYGSGYGELSFTNKDGEKFQGGYNKVDNAVAGVGSFGWAEKMDFPLYQPGKLMRSASLTGDKGTTIDIVYSVDPKTRHGFGVGKDSIGRQYKIKF